MRITRGASFPVGRYPEQSFMYVRVFHTSHLSSTKKNYTVVLGMAFLVGGIRFSEQEFMLTAANLNTSLLVLSVMALVIPTAFALALEQSVGPAQEREVILKMSRGASIILIAIYVFYLGFQLFTHRFLYTPEPHSPPSSRRSSVSGEEARPARLRPLPEPLPTFNRANSYAFGTAAQLGGGGRIPTRRQQTLNYPLRGNSIPLTQADVEKNDKMLSNASTKDHELETPAMNPLISIGTLVVSTGLCYLTAEAITDSLEGIGESGAVSTEWLVRFLPSTSTASQSSN